MPRKLNPCGKCQHVGYNDAFSEWVCKKYNHFLGYSLNPHKGHFCDVIGQDGDIRLIKAMFAWLEGDGYL
jgi:hypothetical protein